MSKSFKALGLAVGVLALSHLPAAAQTKVTNEGVSASEIVIGTHQDLSGPIKVWGVPVSNGMKMAVEEINAAGGIQGRKLKMILEDNAYDPKKGVLASQKMVERDKIFAMIGSMGSAPTLAAQDILFDAGVLQLFPLTAAEFTFKFDAAKPQERLKFNNLLPYVESTREAKKLGWDVTFLGATPTNVLEVPALGKDAVEGLYAASGFEIPYEDTAKGKVKDWLINYKKMFGTDANTQAIIGYNAVETFAFYVNKAGKDLTGQKVLDALESGDKFLDIFSSPPTKFSKTDHLANTVTQVQQIKNGRWVLMKDSLSF